MMKEKLEKAKTFVKEHKRELAIGAGVAGIMMIGGVVYMITKKKPKIANISESVFHTKDLEKPKMDIGTLTDLWQEGGYINAILNDVTVADLGAVGEQFLKIDGVTNDTVVSAVISLLDKVEE